MKKAREGAWKLCQTKDNPAITRFESVSCEPNLRLFILKPQTGKTHQLRVAMKSLGSPILGDGLYAKNTEKIDRTYLHATQLEFDYLNNFISVTCLPSQGQFWIKPTVFEQIQVYLTKPFYQNRNLCIIKPISLFNRNKNEIYFFQYKWVTCSPTST